MLFHIDTPIKQLKRQKCRLGSNKTFHGAVLDIAARTSVIGISQAQAYCR